MRLLLLFLAGWTSAVAQPAPGTITPVKGVSQCAGLTADGAGNLYFVGENGVVQKRATGSGILSTVATPESDRSLFNDVAVDAAGNVYLSDTMHNLVWKVAGGKGAPAIFAGSGNPRDDGTIGDRGPATSAALIRPTYLAVDSEGNLYIADSGNFEISTLPILTRTRVSSRSRSPGTRSKP